MVIMEIWRISQLEELLDFLFFQCLTSLNIQEVFKELKNLLPQLQLERLQLSPKTYQLDLHVILRLCYKMAKVVILE